LVRVRTLDAVDELRRVLLDFRDTYDATWPIERHGFRQPGAIRREQLQPAALAA
jgi:putative transposase